MKKTIAIILIVTVCCTLIVPAYASEITDSFNITAPSQKSDVINAFDSEMSSAYINLTKKLDGIGRCFTLSFEEFAEGYAQGTCDSLDAYEKYIYEAECRNEITNTPNSCFNPNANESFETSIYQQNLETVPDQNATYFEEYSEMLAYFKSTGYNISLPYTIFEAAYSQKRYDDVYEFIARIVDINYSNPYSRSTQWFDNLGTTASNSMLTNEADYTRYNILDVARRGDIIYENTGGLTAITGHIAIVQGKYYDVGYDMYYIRTIEAIPAGVVYGVLDDDRYELRSSKIYAVSGATASQKDYAVDFCYRQIGDSYNMGVILSPSGYCHTSSSVNAWYCSELVWAGYYSTGINLNGASIPANIYYPAVMAASSLLVRRTVSTH